MFTSNPQTHEAAQAVPAIHGDNVTNRELLPMHLDEGLPIKPRRNIGERTSN